MNVVVLQTDQTSPIPKGWIEVTDDLPLPPDADPLVAGLADHPIPDEAGIAPGEDDPEASEVDIPDLED